MKSKKIYKFIAVFAVLVVIFIIQNNSSDKKSITETYTNLSKEIDRAVIGKISVYRPDNIDSGLVLIKQDDIWKVESKYNVVAKNTEIEKLLDNIADLNGDLRGENEELAADFGLTDSTAAIIEIGDRTGNTILTFQLGKRSADYRGSFIREKGSHLMYLTKSDLISSAVPHKYSKEGIRLVIEYSSFILPELTLI